MSRFIFRTLLAALLLSGTVVPALGASPEPELQTSRIDGITSVEAIAQSPDGWLWFGGPAGLVRFDGVRVAPVDGPWKHDPVREVLVDATGRLYLITGLAKLGTNNLINWGTGRDRLWVATLDRGRVVGWRELLRSVWTAAVGPDGTLAVATSEGLERFSPHGERLPTLAWPKSASPSMANPRGASALAMTFDRQGTLWLGGGWGLASLQPGAPRVSPPMGPAVRALATSAAGVFVGREDEISLQGSSLRWPLGRDSTLTMATEPEGLWVASSGVMRHGLSGNSLPMVEFDGMAVRRMFFDRDGTLWIGTWGTGVFRVRSRGVQNVRLSGKATVPFSVLASRTGHLWVTSTAGLHRLSPDGSEQHIPLATLGVWSPRGLAELSDGTIALAADGHGLVLLRGDQIARVQPTVDGEPAAVTMVFAPRNGGLLLGLAGGRVRLVPDPAPDSPTLAEGNGSDLDTGSGLCPGNPVAAAEARDGSLWLAHSFGGVSIWDGQTGRCVDQRAGLPSPNPTALLADPDGGMWVGFGDAVGLAHVRAGVIDTVPPSAGLAVARIHGLTRDPDDRLWLTSDQGIAIVRRADAHAVRRGERARLQSVRLGLGDGLPSEDCIASFQPSIARLNTGRIAVPTLSGLALLPGDPPERRHPLTTFISGIRARGREIAPIVGTTGTPAVELSEDDEPVEMWFTAPTSVRPEHVRFEYQQSPATAWTPLNDGRLLHIANLEPGRLHLKVRAIDEIGDVIGSTAEITLQVHPPWWRHPLSMVGAVCALLAIAGLTVRVRVRQYRQRAEAVSLERQRLARELHDGMAQGFTSIGIHLAAVERRAQKEAPDLLPSLEQTQQVVERCSLVARDAIWNLRTLTANMSLTEAVDAAIHRVESQGIEIRFEASGRASPMPTEVLYELPLIAQEATVNAIRHGRSRTVQVALHEGPDCVELTVEDDGLGFDPDAARNGDPRHGFGIAGMKERAARIGGGFALTSAPGRGTCVRVRVRLKAARGGRKGEE